MTIQMEKKNLGNRRLKTYFLRKVTWVLLPKKAPQF